MALSPKDVQPQVEERRNAIEIVVTRLEDQINDTLRNAAPFVGEEVSYPLTNEIPRDIITRVISDYKSKGWQVRHRIVNQYPESYGLTFSYTEASLE